MQFQSNYYGGGDQSQEINDENTSLNPIDINEPIEGILISDHVAENAPILQVAILEGLPDMLDEVLWINAQGYNMSKRNKKDGCTIIGSLEKHDSAPLDYINDYVIPNHQVNNESQQ
jgi:pSer/pThr/pTyr-binding forkhead associated (FHA) protein